MREFAIVFTAVVAGGLVLLAASKQWDTRCVSLLGSTFCGTAITPR